MENNYNTNLPEVHDVLRELRKVADEYDAVLIGETWTKDVSELNQYYGEHGNELQMPMDFMFTMVNKLSPAEFRRQIAAVDSAGGWPVFVHQQSRHRPLLRPLRRWAEQPRHRQADGALYLTLRGTPIMYYGEEIGMENNDPVRKEDVKDPIGRMGWPQEKGRDGERTPMQWDDSPNAGFTRGTPWLPVPLIYKTVNVASELKDPASILNVYRSLLTLRHQNRALLDGDYVALNENDPNVLSYLRRYKNEAVLVVLNMSSKPQEVSFDLAPQGFPAKNAQTLLTTMATGSKVDSVSHLSLEPFSVYIGAVSK